MFLMTCPCKINVSSVKPNKESNSLLSCIQKYFSQHIKNSNPHHDWSLAEVTPADSAYGEKKITKSITKLVEDMGGCIRGVNMKGLQPTRSTRWATGTDLS